MKKRSTISAADDSLLRCQEVIAKTGMPKSTIYYRMRHDQFPRPVKLGARAVAWRASDVVDWLQNLTKSEGGAVC